MRLLLAGGFRNHKIERDFNASKIIRASGRVLHCIPPLAATAANAGTQVSGPVVHDNLAVYFVHGSAAQNAVPMSLEEALAKGRLRVNETGSVNELTVENVGDDEVFVQAGEIVKVGVRIGCARGGYAVATGLRAGTHRSFFGSSSSSGGARSRGPQAILNRSGRHAVA